MDYEQPATMVSDMVKLDMLVNGEPVDAFSCMCTARKRKAVGGRSRQLKEVIPGSSSPSLFKRHRGKSWPANRERLSQDVTQVLWRDITRKRKLSRSKRKQKADEIDRLVNIPRSFHRSPQGLGHWARQGRGPWTRATLTPRAPPRLVALS